MQKTTITEIAASCPRHKFYVRHSRLKKEKGSAGAREEIGLALELQPLGEPGTWKGLGQGLWTDSCSVVLLRRMLQVTQYHQRQQLLKAADLQYHGEAFRRRRRY